MTTKLQDPKTAAKTYWAILSRLLYKKKFQQYHLYLLMVNLPRFCEKANLFNNLFAPICTTIKSSSLLHIFFNKQSTCDHRPENCLSFSKNRPKKLFSNCLVEDLLTSIV